MAESLAAARVLRYFDDARHRSANLYDDGRHRKHRSTHARCRKRAQERRDPLRHRCSGSAVQLDLRSGFCAADPRSGAGLFRLKVGDLEVTTLYDASAVFQLDWLKGQKASIDGVARALRQDPHLLDAADLGFLVNTGKQLILVDAGAGTWYGGGAFGRLAGSLRSAGYTPEQVDLTYREQIRKDRAKRAARGKQDLEDWMCEEGLEDSRAEASRHAVVQADLALGEGGFGAALLLAPGPFYCAHGNRDEADSRHDRAGARPPRWSVSVWSTGWRAGPTRAVSTLSWPGTLSCRCSRWGW